MLLCSVIASLDGRVADEDGRIDWAAPDEEVHAFVNDLERPIGTYLYGRRMYETMAGWETDPGLAARSAASAEFAALGQAAEKVVYSRTLDGVATRRTRIERSFRAEAVRRLGETAVGDVSGGGAELAAEALRAGLVDELHLFVVPVVVGGGKPAIPQGVRVPLELLDERRFVSGTVYLRYRGASRAR
jgi:dihydrofolate reductase